MTLDCDCWFLDCDCWFLVVEFFTVKTVTVTIKNEKNKNLLT